MNRADTEGLNEQLDALRTKWPQAHAVEQIFRGKPTGWHMIFLPGVRLPKGWDKTICTAFWLTRVWGNKAGSPIDGFYVDLDLRLANKAHAHYSREFARNDWEDFWHEPTKRMWSGKEEIPGFPQWRELTRFWWRQQHWNPNYQTLYTSAMVIMQRLNPAR